MKDLREEIKACIFKELDRAMQQHPLFASDHEAKSVLEEELDEMQDEVKYAESYFNLLWLYVKKDETEFVFNNAMELEDILTNVACEAAQAAAMCLKLRYSQMERINNNGK